ncbi:hypothetical protein BU23DRAFT_588544 [Bimuria novae-zelandiae CBS 107.79]|uniref:Vacuolar ATPase assembly protein VMA22 n=1 Tax=Bimuria novae-zelandiae CBS 107.79 TaxID=1447943 RepID=A0A6A5VET4_9PLEO|nr:hypothetical protein BU23DRAFT_588544 [Bimuria novae-zelandiae CBS 107.79]
MADVEVQKAPIANHAVTSRDDLIARLDELLEQYLHTLDAYQKAQQQLAKQLSSGYMSLAQANFTNTTRLRYGQDYYDARMRATRKVVITEENDNLTFGIEALASEEPKHNAEEPSPSGDEPSEAQTHPQPKKEPASTNASNEKTESSESEKKAPVKDPITWFGVLVPPALRSAQTAFVSAVEGPVGTLSKLSKELKRQEIEIGRVRKQIKKL